MSLSHEKCFNHPGREAVARCPECGRFFCRECVSEHEDRLLCASCLERLVAAPGGSRTLAWSFPVIQALVGFLLLWLSFYSVGRLLIAIPSSFHDLGVPPGAVGP